MAYFDALYPWMLHYILDLRSSFWVGLKHLPYQRSACSWIQVVNRRREGCMGGGCCGSCLAGRSICCIKLIRCLRDAPRKFLKMQAVIDDPACPYVDETRIVRYGIHIREWLQSKATLAYVCQKTALERCMVRFHKAQWTCVWLPPKVTGTQSKRRSLQSEAEGKPCSYEYLKQPHHLQMTFCIEKQVLRLDIAMRYTLAMQICYAGQNLFEATLDFTWRHATFLNRRVEVASRTKFHHFAPVLSLVLH